MNLKSLSLSHTLTHTRVQFTLAHKGTLCGVRKLQSAYFGIQGQRRRFGVEDGEAGKGGGMHPSFINVQS